MGSEPIWQGSFVKDQPRKHLIYIYIYIYILHIYIYIYIYVYYIIIYSKCKFWKKCKK